MRLPPETWAAARERSPHVRDRKRPWAGRLQPGRAMLLGRSVVLYLTGRTIPLTPEEADQLAAELVRVAAESRLRDSPAQPPV